MNRDEPLQKTTGPSPAEAATLPSAPAAGEEARCDGLLACLIAGFGVAETLAAFAFMDKDQLFFVVIALAGLIPWLGLAWMALRVARSGCSVLVILLAAIPMVLGTLVCHFGLAASMREFGGLAYIYATTGLFLIAGATAGIVSTSEDLAGRREAEQRRAAELQNIRNLPPGKPAVIPPPRRPTAESVRQDSSPEHAPGGMKTSAPGIPCPVVPEPLPDGSQLPPPKHEQPCFFPSNPSLL